MELYRHFSCKLLQLLALTWTGHAISWRRALAATTDVLADMKRHNAAESDHRNIMTPEFRAFCTATREHVVCCATVLVIFLCSYLIVQRACARSVGESGTDLAAGLNTSIGGISGVVDGARHRTGLAGQWGRRQLVLPYTTVFRARQVALVAAATGLGSAGLTGLLLAATVALANAMEHGGVDGRVSWRTWLLPVTLMAPGDAAVGVSDGQTGPQAAHEFPPILRRLWVYQSIVSVAAAAVIVPTGVMFERGSRRATTRRRLFIAAARWAAAATIALGMWEAACMRSAHLRGLGLYRSLVSNGATLRYSIHYAACIFVLLPAVPAIVPRGAWALLVWLRSCVGQRQEIAEQARGRCGWLRRERARIERNLQQDIGLWKREQFNEPTIAKHVDAVGGEDSRAETEAQQCPSNSPRRPPAHPGLGHKLAARPYQTVSVARGRMVLRRLVGEGAELLTSKGRKLLADRVLSRRSPVLYYSDTTDTSGDEEAGRARYTVRRAAVQLRRERECEMQALARRIKRNHTQLRLVDVELAQIAGSGVLGSSGAGATGRRAVGALILAAAGVCWLLVVAQVGRGALSALFVGEPDLTQPFTYFMPALSSVTPAPAQLSVARSVPRSLVLAPLTTACQVAGGAALFAAALCGILALGSTVEDSVHPLRLAATVHVERVLRARQWLWLPRFLLHAEVLAAIDPSAARALAAGVSPRRVAGNTLRAFFSSSAELTSYHRQLQQNRACALLPGALPTSVLQTCALGRHVFLPLHRGARPASLRQMLAYTWVICVLAMTWPSVLRTAGLISERAYVLPMASLVEPLWSPYVLEEPLVLLPARSRPLAALRQPSPPSVSVESLLPSVSLEPEACMAMPELRVTRRHVLNLLSTDTPSRLLVRWALQMSRAVSPHTAAVLAYCVWWVAPDLVVPLSRATVDQQLGITLPVHVPLPAVTFGAVPPLSEWYGMLRRLECGTVHLPQASDGTPLMLSPAAEPAKAAPPAAAGVGARAWSVFCTVINRLWGFVLVCGARLAGARLQGLAASATLQAVLRTLATTAGLVWTLLLRPLWYHFVLGPVGLLGSISSLLFRVGAKQAASGFSAAGDAVLMADGGIASAVPPLFLAAFWDAIATASDPALLRLRPELWPHALGHEVVPTHYYIHDTTPRYPPPPSQPLRETGIGSRDGAPLQPLASSFEAIPPEPRPPRLVWSAMDWLLAAYRILLGILACRAVFGPARSSAAFTL
ncbi:hypothetical protein COEREDRAFT_89178 [Coemansia reversa NRRL 1564]|uniref:Uncharacterized protein n=1 Tax=Coemansia reversa (strain ATCC 12441 / NRRL 1564) TaxID=763665 RepID=A0A2G5B4N7_COERN|nr:hypothetical protein COEREDRAFT_89178 [Coemansia reversa NRRL 1564]|eukprot:PIA13965.1 hypothetical protein COEREDRAFT_89178 [Coemansia reversa NRRL 1564]